jgi:peptidyl-prolyl cis-trans isomerase D
MALGYMRRHRRWLFVFLWLVIAAFIILYIPAFQDSTAGSPSEVLATVGGLPITVGEYQRNYMRQRQMYERMYQGRLDANALRNLGLETQVFDGLVVQRVVQLEARRLGLTVDDATVAKSLTTAPEFQEDGRYIGGAEIRRRLELSGLTVEEFEEDLRRRLLRERLESLVTDGISVTPAEAEREFRRRNEQVKAEYVLVDAARFKPEVSVTDDEVRARFESKRDSYRIPEKRVLSYVLVDPEALKSRVSLTDGDLESYYQQNRDEFREEEQVCASHILVKVKQGPQETEGHGDEEARTIAQGLLEKVRGGADFAEIARTASEDQGSGPSGGDLGCFPRGRMTPEFENAAFDLAAGETSDLVKTPFGYHVIRVASRRDETVPPLTQVKERIRQLVLGQRVQTLAGQQVQAISAALVRGRSISEAAKEQGLAVQKSAPMARGASVEPLTSPSLMARAFEMKKGDVEKEAFPVGRGYAFVALDEVQPSRLPELKEVETAVRNDLLEEKAFEKARLLADEVRAAAEKAGVDKGGLEQAATAKGLVRKETPALTGRGQSLGDLGTGHALDEAAFSTAEKALSAPVRVATGHAVLRVLEKKPFDPAAFEQQKVALMSSLRQEKRSQLFQAYLNQARERFTLERRAEAFQRILG